MTIPKIASYPMPTDFPANRVDWQPDPKRAVLLIHDMQDYFLDFFDRNASPIPQLLQHIQSLRAACVQAGIPIVYTAQPPVQSLAQRGLLQDWWGPGITQQPQRADIEASLAPQEGDTVLTKWRYSAFARTDLAERMQAWGRDQLIICGVYAHIGCLMTAGDAFMRDIQPFLVADALADFSLAQHQQGLNYVAERCGVVLGQQAICAALVGQCTTALPNSLPELCLTLAQLLDLPPDELQADDNLLFAGLDSIRLMTLLQGWRAAGVSLDFEALGSNPTPEHWWGLLQQARLG